MNLFVIKLKIQKFILTNTFHWRNKYKIHKQQLRDNKIYYNQGSRFMLMELNVKYSE